LRSIGQGSWLALEHLAPTGMRGIIAQQEEEPVMGLGKQAKDKAKEIKGKAKKNTGKATGDNKLKVKGKTEELAGKVKLKGERAKRAAK
jgi:uncharacterized protein YjbJ (UPF0337 family)